MLNLYKKKDMMTIETSHTCRWEQNVYITPNILHKKLIADVLMPYLVKFTITFFENTSHKSVRKKRIDIKLSEYLPWVLFVNFANN